MKKILLGLILGGAFIGANAQQEAQYTQYNINPYLINPALGGVEDMIDIKTGYRAQWVGFSTVDPNETQTGVFDDNVNVAPRTTYLTAHMPIGEPHQANSRHYKGEHHAWHGVGTKLISDKTGPTSWNSFMVSYSYNMGIIKPKGSGIYTSGGLRMSAGLFLGMQQFKLESDNLTFPDGNGDPTKFDNSKTSPDATLGIWLYNDLFYVGVSSNHIFGNEIPVNVNYAGFVDADENNRQGSNLARHYFITAGTNFEMTPQLMWKPSILIKATPPAPVSIDLNSRFEYEEKYWGAISYRHLDAISLSAGAVINYMFEVAYSYDYTTTDIRSAAAGGTHELMVGVRLLPKMHGGNAEDHWK